MKRNLLYNCFPSDHSDEWRLNVERLCHYAGAFNGRLLVMLKTGPGTIDPEQVFPAFAPLGNVEFRMFENDPSLGEVRGFIETLAELESTDAKEATFYAHTKGTKYKNAQLPHMNAIRKWRNKMYEECLRDIPHIDRVMGDRPTAGCYLRWSHPLVDRTRWHFAGTFWWVRHDALFTHPEWRDVEQNFYGVEGYLGRLFSRDDAFCLHQSHPAENLYEARASFRCSCGHEFIGVVRAAQEERQVCAQCCKRRAEFVALIDETDFL